MVTLTMGCDRCSKETEVDLSNSSFNSEDEVRKAGFRYVNNGQINIMICTGCYNKYKELIGMQEEKAYLEVCHFFDNCTEREKNELYGRTENG